MDGFVETRNGEEHPLDLDDIEKLTPETHPELIARISDSASKDLSPNSSAETPHASALDQEELPLIPLTRSSSVNRPSTPASSSKSTSPQYYILVSEAAIRDKSKTNALAKLITLAQTTWFILQFIERWATHQPRTQLEVMTMAYAVLNAMVYALWWNKPYNVDEPINVSGRARDCARTRTIGVWAPQSILRDVWQPFNAGFVGDRGAMALMVLVLVGGLFGGLHCFAWRFHFPTEQEAILWRVCAVYCTAAPVVISVPPLLNMNDEFVGVWAFVITMGYIICRLLLLALTLSSLRALPAGVFEITAWTKFIPHIS